MIPLSKIRRPILALAVASLLPSAAQALNYQWNGTIDGVWTVAGNWAPTGLSFGQNNTQGPGPTGGTFGHRLSVTNAANPLIYDATLGTTVYANSGAGLRGLVIGSGTGTPGAPGGSMIITGGTFSTLGSNAADVMANSSVSGATSTLTIDGGTFISTNAGMIMNFGGTNNVAVLNVLSGTATMAAVNLSQSGGGSGTINLDGGLLELNSVTKSGTGTATFNFNGGTLRARQASTGFMTGLNSAVVKAGGAVIDTNGVDVTIAQALLDGTGGGGLTKNSAGRLTLTGANTYTGTTTINAGTLEIGNGGASGTIGSGAVVNNGTLAINRSGILSIPGAISGPGNLTIAGGANVTLGGASTYAGATTVNAGQLNIAGSLTSNVTIANGANLGGEGSTTGSITFGGVNTLFFNPGTPAALTAASIDAAGATVTLSLSGISGAANGIVVLDAPGGITGTAGVNFLFAGRGTTYLNPGATQLLFDYTPASLKWTGAAANPTFWDINTTENWLNGVNPDKFIDGDGVTFDDSATATDVAVQGVQVMAGNLTFSNETKPYTVSGGAIAGSGVMTKLSAAPLTLASTNTFTGGVQVQGGIVNADAAGALGTGVVTVASGARVNLRAGGVTYTHAGLSGEGDVHVTLGAGTATTVLTGSNANFVGTLFVGADALPGAGRAELQGALNENAAINVLPHATLSVTGPTSQPSVVFLHGGDTGESVGQLRLDSGATWAGPVILAGEITGGGDGAIGSNAGVSTISGVIGEAGGTRPLTKVGAGTIALTAENVFTGPVSVLGGALNIQVAAALGLGTSVSVANNAALELQGGITVSGRTATLTGGGGGGGQLGALRSVSGNNTWTGDIVAVPGGGVTRLSADAGLFTVSGNIQMTGGVSDLLVVQGAGDMLVSGIISGSGVLNGSSNGLPTSVRTITGANTFTGQTRINGGILSVGTLNSVVGGQPSSNLGAPLDVLNGTITLGSPAGVGTLRYTGPGETTDRVLSLTGSVNGGVVEANGSGPVVFTSQTTATVAGVKSLTLTGTGRGELLGGIGNGSGSISVVKAGSGTWVLDGISTYAGTTAINEGTLIVNGTLPAGSTTTVLSGTLTGSGATGPIVANGGIVAPGNGPGVMTANGGLTMNIGSTLSLDIDTPIPATGYDQFFVNGPVNLANTTLSITGGFEAFPGAPSDFFFVLMNDGLDSIAGTFAGLAEGGIVTAINGQPYQITYQANGELFELTGGNDVALVSVPEPGAAVLLLGGLGAMTLRRRRRTE